MIIVPRSQPVNTAYLQKMLYDKEMIAALAAQLVGNQVEAHIDMISDAGTEYKTFSEVESCIQGAKETVEDYVADLLTDFRESLYEAIRATQITVSKVEFEKDGLKDAAVEVK